MLILVVVVEITLLLDTSELSKVSIFRVLMFNNDQVVSSSGGRLNKKSFMFKKSFSSKIYFYLFKASVY